MSQLNFSVFKLLSSFCAPLLFLALKMNSIRSPLKFIHNFFFLDSLRLIAKIIFNSIPKTIQFRYFAKKIKFICSTTIEIGWALVLIFLLYTFIYLFYFCMQLHNLLFWLFFPPRCSSFSMISFFFPAHQKKGHLNVRFNKTWIKSIISIIRDKMSAREKKKIYCDIKRSKAREIFDYRCISTFGSCSLRIDSKTNDNIFQFGNQFNFNYFVHLSISPNRNTSKFTLE